MIHPEILKAVKKRAAEKKTMPSNVVRAFVHILLEETPVESLKLLNELEKKKECMGLAQVPKQNWYLQLSPKEKETLKGMSALYGQSISQLVEYSFVNFLTKD